MTQAIELKNRSGKSLRGMLTLPEGLDKAPCYINLHGFSGTMGGFRSAHVHLSRTLMSIGIACVRFDFYGNGESDGEFEEMTFTSLLNDTQDVCEWVRTQEWFNGRLILSGQSLGGLVAASAAPLVNPFALVLMCPGASMWYGCKQRSDALKEKGVMYGDIGGLKFSHDFNYDLAKYSPFEDATGYAGPVLLVRGTADELVSADIIKQYVSGYINAQYVEVENADHNFGTIPARAACEAEILKFLKSRLI